MSTERLDDNLITIGQAIEYTKALIVQSQSRTRNDITGKYIEDTIRGYSTWEHQDIIKMIAKKLDKKQK